MNSNFDRLIIKQKITKNSNDAVVLVAESTTLAVKLLHIRTTRITRVLGTYYSEVMTIRCTV